MVLDKKNKEVIAFLASKTIIATGGLGQLLHSTNPKGAAGDGIAMAWRARQDVLIYTMFSFIQRHYIIHPEGLISEAVREKVVAL